MALEQSGSRVSLCSTYAPWTRCDIHVNQPTNRTSLHMYIHRYIKGYFKSSYDPTIEDAYVKQTEVDGKVVTLNILDTAGQEEYTSLRDQYLRDSEGFLMVFSLTDASSFHEIREIFEQLARSKEDDATIHAVLLGNKCDLVHERVVQREEVDELLQDLRDEDNMLFHGTVKYMECSAKERINVDEPFAELVRMMRKGTGQDGDKEDQDERNAKVKKDIPVRRGRSHRIRRRFLRMLCSLNPNMGDDEVDE